MFEDEARFGRITEIARSWAPPGVRPEVKAQIIREYTYAYGSVSPVDGDTFNLVLPDCNTDCMKIYLNELSNEYSNYLIVLVVDQAKWHINVNLEVPENIRLLPLPPHSPELNPQEHIWDYMRENFFPNKSFDSLEETEIYLSDSLKTLRNNKKEIKSLTFYDWLNGNI
jgi:transposase